MDEIMKFREEVRRRVEENWNNEKLRTLSMAWHEEADRCKYEYNFRWLGRPAIQYPQDIVAIQEIIWETRPDLVIETGIAHGGSLIFYASILELLGGDGQVIGIDNEIRKHNRIEIEKHPMFKRIVLVEGSSISSEIVQSVKGIAGGKKNILLILDSNHTRQHVLSELRLYSPFVRKRNYIVVYDTSIEYLSGTGYPDRPWGKGNNPLTAVNEFLKSNDRFVIDEAIAHKLIITSAPGGFLKCIRD